VFQFCGTNKSYCMTADYFEGENKYHNKNVRFLSSVFNFVSICILAV